MCSKAALHCFSKGTCVTAPAAADHNDPVDAGFARGDEVPEGAFGGDGKDLPGCIEAYDAREGGDGVLAVRRVEFRNLAAWYALFLKSRIRQLLADVVGHLNDHADWIRHAGFLHSPHHVRGVVIEQLTSE